MGRDIFNIPVEEKGGVSVVGLNTWIEADYLEDDCSPDSDGVYCATKLLRDGKMDY